MLKATKDQGKQTVVKLALSTTCAPPSRKHFPKAVDISIIDATRQHTGYPIPKLLKAVVSQSQQTILGNCLGNQEKSPLQLCKLWLKTDLDSFSSHFNFCVLLMLLLYFENNCWGFVIRFFQFSFFFFFLSKCVTECWALIQWQDCYDEVIFLPVIIRHCYRPGALDICCHSKLLHNMFLSPVNLTVYCTWSLICFLFWFISRDAKAGLARYWNCTKCTKL